jgi:4-diphosphocytidyl-2-C-methyl-D-erythritol kinase
MLLFSNCKINIGLSITAKRADGYHDLESLFFPVPWYDALEIIKSDTLSLTITGIDIPGDISQNLCLRAWHMLKQDFPALPPVEIHLHKTIPAGAGLGGGSSNGAFMLKALNTTFDLGLNSLELSAYALRLGSDCPFFIQNLPAIAWGRGEILQPMPINLTGYHLVLANPGIHVATGWAFGQLKPHLPERPIEELCGLPVGEWEKAGIKNDFEAPVFGKYPAIGTIRTILKENGADFAAMSGTGSTCFGFFPKDPGLSTDDFPAGTLVRSFVL